MASGRSYYSRPNYRFLDQYQRSTTTTPLSRDPSGFELEESDLYNSAVSTRSKSPEVRTSHVKKAAGKRGDQTVGSTPGSLPVNIPDWSKILREEYRESRRRSESDDDDDGGVNDWSDGGVRVPPHEFLARTRIASFSVHEGIGRTLKGRDLRMVRNAIFEKTGFED